MAIALDAGLAMPERTTRCLLENVSRTGCRLRLAEPPRVGATVLIKVERIEALGSVTWVKGDRCGISFEEILATQSLERLRWIIENDNGHQFNNMANATAIWR
jgi:hypothetical protein